LAGTQSNELTLNKPVRPDLPKQGLYALLALAALFLIFTLYTFNQQAPGSALAQGSAAIGVCLLLAPMFFSILKRSGFTDSPPLWFVAHVLGSSFGICLVFIHVAGGNWVSPPGLVLFLMLFLLLQGVLLRTAISEKFSYLFARNSTCRGFALPDMMDKTALAITIDKKIECLWLLDPNASEALFSPTLRHWLTHPWLSFRYQLLIGQEARMVGARQAAGALLAWSRRIHILAAVLFYAGLLTHIIIVLFFAGYAAGDGDIDWWYVTDWGR
jgi:hypothetical protein